MPKSVSATEKAAASVKKAAESTFELNQFDRAASQLSSTGKDNIRILRGWAKSKGWERFSETGRPEMWGEYVPSLGKYEWRLKIKPEAGFRNGLQEGSRLPRFDSRFGGGEYVNPFTFKIGGREIGTHLPLENNFY
ncbi:unknown protein [Waddlia chondrophila 2032/99]|uniref:Uncharacterized protein n=1 Tax=Waddlia chondrophila 2032/99 TaxID=765953 RepID=F8LEA0_9BACT|nr:unknown protein [Waddlia chondrophila 2032/99]